jgi:fructosamine-3-kinase
MQVPEPILQSASQELKRVHPSASIQSFSFSAGGCINSGGKLDTSIGPYFLKWNDAKLFPGMFEKEAVGLRTLEEARAIRVPKVVATGQAGNYQFLLLEYIESRSKSKNFWEITGRRLARLHQTEMKTFGLDHDNYMGSLPQLNTPRQTWVEFFIEQRLTAQVKEASRSDLITNDVMKKFDALFAKLPSLLPEVKPRLVHGDLWSGNLMVDDKGEGCLIDPAIYGGHSEVDLAMTQLFGGFDDAFLAAYHEESPLLPGYRDRFDLYNLYPLLVHVNLFGRSYLSSVNSILNRFA